MISGINIRNWGLETHPLGELSLHQHKLTEIAGEFGTPLYVLNKNRLEQTACEFIESAISNYSGKTSVHYALKCNSVPYVVQTLRDCGLKAEVMTPFELELALSLGFDPGNIIVNGPGKTNEFLLKCMSENVRLIIIDSAAELYELGGLLEHADKTVDVLLRINPDYIPPKMNKGSATGSRNNCAFGFDMKGGEVHSILNYLKDSVRINFRGYHFHIGTGIFDPKAYSNTVEKLAPLFSYTLAEGLKIDIIDVGGGFASQTSREFTSLEMLMYQAFDHLPEFKTTPENNYFENFFDEITSAIERIFDERALPEIIYEPGRCIVSSSQLLLLKVIRIKERVGTNKWLITDGGLGTITLPTFYEYHELLLCNSVIRPYDEIVTITGPCCFAGDIVYKNKSMPKVFENEILALMDTGAYFNTMESSFGFPKPAIVAVKGNEIKVIRKRESYNDMVSRDINLIETRGEQNEIYSNR